MARMSSIRLPNDATGNTLRSLVADGSSLDRPMRMDFDIVAPTEQACARIVQDLELDGFEVTGRPQRYEESDRHEYTATVTTTIVPSYETVTATEAKVDNIARRYGGAGDGFGSFGNAEG